MEKYLESRRRRIESGERYYAQLANNPPKEKEKRFFKQAVQLPFKAVREVTKPIVKNLPKGVRNALPYVGAIGGALLGGPIGGMAGGALGGSMRGGRHVADRALEGRSWWVSWLWNEQFAVRIWWRSWNARQRIRDCPRVFLASFRNRVGRCSYGPAASQGLLEDCLVVVVC